MNGILEYLHYGITLLFGVYLTAAFLGIRFNGRNVLILLLFSCGEGILNIISYVWLGFDVTEKIYPLIIHLPLVLFLVFLYRVRVISVVVALSVSYLCCQISNWMGLFINNFIHLDWIYYSVRIVISILFFIVLIRFVTWGMEQLLQKSVKDILIFGLMPLVYYIYDYGTTVYTALSYSGVEVVTEFLGFVLCLFYILFIIVYYKQYEEKQEAENRNHLMEMQRIQSEKEVEMMKRSEYAVTILQHDMRHFLRDIDSFIENGRQERAQEYIREIIAKVDKAATKKYCSNGIMNMILSSYENVITEKAIDFKYFIEIPKELGFSDSDISAILSNGLENAIHAVSVLEKENRKIELDIHMNNDKLLISIKNTYGEKPKLVDGLPQTKEKGHGFGTQSIRYMTEKLKGNCQFIVNEQYFVLRIVL